MSGSFLCQISNSNSILCKVNVPPTEENYYPQTSDIIRTLVGNKIDDHPDVVGASPVSTAPTTSSFSTKTTARRDEKHLKFVIRCVLYQSLDGNMRTHYFHDDVIKWKHFPRYWPFVRGIHRSPQNSTSKSRTRSYENLVDVVVSGNFWSILAWPCFVRGMAVGGCSTAEIPPKHRLSTA